jgi:uncharacterized protein YciI
VLFAVIARFRSDAEAGRRKNQEAFSDHLAQRDLRLRLAGSLRGPDDAKLGVMALIEAEDIAQVRRLVDSSPYTRAGLYERVDIEGFDLEIGSLG